MKLFGKILPFIFLFSFSWADSQVDLLTKVRTQLNRHPKVHGSFKQIRTVKDLDLRLESSGIFNFKLPLDLNWNQQKPFILNLIMTPDKIIQTLGDGSQQVMTKNEQPVIFIFSSSFLGIFSGDEKSIAQNFSYQVEMKGKKWNMKLEPKDENFKKIITSVEIAGAEFVDKVEVFERSGNTNLILFSKVNGN